MKTIEDLTPKDLTPGERKPPLEGNIIRFLPGYDTGPYMHKISDLFKPCDCIINDNIKDLG